MRQRNWRVVSVGAVLMVLAMGFFVWMMGMAGHSNDPAGLLRTVGETSGVVIGIGLVMVAFGLIGKRVEAKD